MVLSQLHTYFRCGQSGQCGAAKPWPS
jgi:hypothetical protein